MTGSLINQISFTTTRSIMNIVTCRAIAKWQLCGQATTIAKEQLSGHVVSPAM
jgi:hypothetical protein